MDTREYQIEKVFKGISEDIYRTKSGSDMIEKLNSTMPWLFCSLIHKFGNKKEVRRRACPDEAAHCGG
jgi:type I restriction enzyme R subunit